jgi:hypothetical protein
MSDPVNKTPDDDPRDDASDPKYGDLLLVDILRPDFGHFFSRYRVDIVGFLVVSLIVLFIIVGTKWLVMIGAGDAARARPVPQSSCPAADCASAPSSDDAEPTSRWGGDEGG